MNEQEKTKEELQIELQELKQETADLKVLYDATVARISQEEALLQQTRTNYETFFNTINDFLFVLDEQGNIIHTNSTVTDRLGYTQEELYGLSVLMVHPPERRDEAGRIVGEMLSGMTEFCPVPIITKAGIQIPVETRVSQGFWDGKPVVFGVTKDISKVKLSEEKFSKVFYLNPSVCGLSDLDTGEYIEVNDQFYSLLGFEKNEVIGNTASSLGILTQEAIQAVMSKAEINGNVHNIETDLKASNGDIKHVLLSAENIYVQDKKYRFTVVHDITEIKKAEKEIKLKNEELLKMNAEKDKFYSIIAHDLRSPFNGFLGLTEAMAVNLPDLTLISIQEIAEKIRLSAGNLYRLLNNLLEWSQIQKGSVRFTPEIIQFRSLIEENIGLVKESAKIKDIEITVDIPEGLEIFADVNMLQTIIRNLVSNAIKFTPKKGKVNISAKLNLDNSLEISIKDTGIGMTQKMIDDLFRIDVSTGRKGTDGELSTGLGLLLCKEFIDKHGGKIRIESIVKAGTTFTFSMPLCLEKARNADAFSEIAA